MTLADLNSPDPLLQDGILFPFLVIHTPAPKMYFAYSSLIIAASHMIQLHMDRSVL